MDKRKRVLISWFMILFLLAVWFAGEAFALQEKNRLEIHFIDVGSGDAILLRSYCDETVRSMMIDTGDRAHAADVTAYIQSCGVNYLEYLVLTHPHADHIGGAKSILNTMSVGKIELPPLEVNTATYGKLMEIIEKKSISLYYPQVGDTLQFGDATLTCYAPAPVLYPTENDWSLVYMLTYAGKRVLFVGDAEYNSEMDMINQGLDLHADILKVGHHGSRTSSSYQFIEAISPQIAVVSCGYTDKEYPNTDVAMNLVDAGVTDILSTNVRGTIILTITEEGIIDFTCEH